MSAPGNRNKRYLTIGVSLLALFGGAAYIGINAHKGLPGAQRTIVSATFTDTGGLRPGDDVRIARVRAGQVEAVALRDGKPIVTLALDGERAIYRDANASIESRSGLGQKIVNIDPGTPPAGALGKDNVIPESQTQGAQNLADLLAVFDEPTRDSLATTLQQTGSGMGGHGPDLQALVRTAPTTLPNLATVSHALTADGGRDLTELLRVADRLTSRFQQRQDQLAALTGELGTTIGAIGTDNGTPLRDTLDRAPDTLRVARTALADLRRPLTDLNKAMIDLRPGAGGLGDATPDLRGVLREAVPPLDQIPPVSRQAEPALKDLTNTLSDARPFAPRAARAVSSASPLLSTLAPYAPEIGLFFDNWASALSIGQAGKGDPNNRHLRVLLMPHTESVDGQPGLRDPFVARNPYPAPGEAEADSTGSLPSPTGGHR